MRIRVVIDANIYASALMKTEGLPAQVLRKIVEGERYELVLSQAILEELHRILFYPKIRSRIKITDQEILAWLDALNVISHLIIPRHLYPILVHDDPDDDIYLIAALESRARYVISGDQHLLKMKYCETVKILTTSEFIEVCRSTPP
jgi:uncharacterized protein